MEIRVGNVVRRIRTDNPLFKIGDYGIVREIENDGIYIDDIREWQCLEYIEVVKDIAIGDKVLRIGEDIADVKKGSTYIIKDIKVTSSGKFSIRVMEEEGEFWYSYEKFEKVGEEKKMLKNTEELKQELIEKLKDFDTRDIDFELREIDGRINSKRRLIKSTIRTLNEHYKELKEYMTEYEQKKLEHVEKDFSLDVNALYNHPSIDEIILRKEDKIIEVITNNIDIYDENSNRYAGGKYKIVFDYRNMDARIFGLDNDYCRQGFWTEYDPHPHVDGDGGYPCWGSAGSMLCQSMNEMELYASYIVVFNFLQQVNTDDCAGKYIEYWDCIDEEGNIITNPHERGRYKCNECGYVTTDSDDIYECYECGENMCYDHKVFIQSINENVCTSCLEEKFARCSGYGSYYYKDEVVEIDGRLYSKEYVEDEFIKCEECEKYIKRRDRYNIEKKDKTIEVCEECAKKLTIICENCAERVLREDAKEHLGENYCESCYEDLFEVEDEENEEEEEATNEY